MAGRHSKESKIVNSLAEALVASVCDRLGKSHPTKIGDEHFFFA
jgi:hypothetical protein